MSNVDSEPVKSASVGSVTTLFEDATFPCDTEEVIDEFGDCEVVYPNGSDSLKLILQTSGSETYDSLEELELAIFNGMRRDAVGRPRYSDRSDEVVQELDRPHQSF